MFEEGGADTGSATGWGHVADHEEAPAVVDAILRLEAGTAYTKTELSEAAGVPLKTFYLDGTFDHLVDMGFLEKRAAEGEAVRYAVDTDSEVYATAAAFDEAVLDRLGDTV